LREDAIFEKSRNTAPVGRATRKTTLIGVVSTWQQVAAGGPPISVGLWSSSET